MNCMLEKILYIDPKSKLLPTNAALIIYQELIDMPLALEDRTFLINKGGLMFIKRFLKDNKLKTIDKIPLKTRTYKIKNLYSPNSLELGSRHFEEISNNIFSSLNLNTSSEEFGWLKVGVQTAYYKSSETGESIDIFLHQQYLEQPTSDILVKNKILEFLKFNQK